MRVLYIDVNCKYSSTGDIVYNLHSSCLRNGIESAICYGRGQKICEPNIFKFGLDWETFAHALLTRITGYTGCFSYFSTRRLVKFIKRFNPDIIHIHELHAYFVNVLPLLKFIRKNGYKVVFTNHCEFIYTGKCGYAKECDKYTKSCGKCPHLKEYPSSLLFDHTARMLSGKKKVLKEWKQAYFVSPSNWLNRQMERSFLDRSTRLVIHNGIDTSRFACPDRHTDNAKLKTIISIAPNIMSDIKGGYRVMKLAERFQGEGVRFVLVGKTDGESIATAKNVTIVPLIRDKDELIKMYGSADLFLICSSFENYPTTCLEAQCCGLPVCGFDVGGVKETILDGQGDLAPYNNFDKLEQIVRKYLASTINHKAIHENSVAAFSNETMFRNYLELYQRL